MDEGAVARFDLGARVALGAHGGIAARPYLFAAAGVGRIDAPTAQEPDHLRAASFGGGLNTSLNIPGLSLAVEYAWGLADLSPLNHTGRVNLTLGLQV